MPKGTQFPIQWVAGNVVGTHTEQTWAWFRLHTVPLAFQPIADQRRLVDAMGQALSSLEADGCMLRVAGQARVDLYSQDRLRLLDPDHGLGEVWLALLREHEQAIAAHDAIEPQVYIGVLLSEPESDETASVVRQIARGVEDGRRRASALFGVQDEAAGIMKANLRLSDQELRAFQILSNAWPCDRASAAEIVWLVERAYLRGVAEPDVLGEGNDDRGLRSRARFAESAVLGPQQLGLEGALVHRSLRGLTVDHGDYEERSYQAFLSIGSLPDRTWFPGAAEFLSLPLEMIDFPVDASLRWQFVTNSRAQQLVGRKRKEVDAVLSDQSASEAGAGWRSQENAMMARELAAMLEDPSIRAPMFMCQASFAVCGTSPQELEARVTELQARMKPARLHRPLGEQVSLFLDHLPGGSRRRASYPLWLTALQLSSANVGSSTACGDGEGPYVGYALTGNRRPIYFDPAAACRLDKSPTAYIAGGLGSGKTLLAQVLCAQMAARGGRVVVGDPKGDWRLAELPALAPYSYVLDLGTAPAGILDPLRMGVAFGQFAGGEEVAASFLASLLPTGEDGAEVAAIKTAVHQEAQKPNPTLHGVLEILANTKEGLVAESHRAAHMLAGFAASGLARLAFAHPDDPNVIEGLENDALVTIIQLRALTLPDPGTPRSDYDETEKVSSALLQLVATFARGLLGPGDPVRPGLLAIDEAWAVLRSSTGRKLVSGFARMGRSLNQVLLLMSQAVADADNETLDELIGTRIMLGQTSDRGARDALTFLGLDPTDRGLCDVLLRANRGRGLMRDIFGQVAEIQIDPGPGLLRAFSTTAGRKVSHAAA